MVLSNAMSYVALGSFFQSTEFDLMDFHLFSFAYQSCLNTKYNILFICTP